MTHEEKELATKITYMLLEAQRGDPNGGKAYQITKMFEDYKRIVSKALASAEKKGKDEGFKELADEAQKWAVEIVRKIRYEDFKDSGARWDELERRFKESK